VGTTCSHPGVDASTELDCVAAAEPPTEYGENGSLTIGFASLAEVAAITVGLSFDSPSAQHSPAAGAAAGSPPARGATSLQNGTHTPAHGSRGRSPRALPPPPARPAGWAAAAAGDAPRARALSETPRGVATPPAAKPGGLGPPRPATGGPPPRPAANGAPGVAKLLSWHLSCDCKPHLVATANVGCK